MHDSSNQAPFFIVYYKTRLTMQLSLFDLIRGINILPFDGEALFHKDFLTSAESEFYLDRLQKEYEFRQVKIHIYKKDVFMPKLTAFSGDPGESPGYFDEDLPVQPWSENLRNLKEKVEPFAGVIFTHALLNLYRDGRDGVSWHRDTEQHWGIEPVIASLSLGAARTFQFRYNENHKITRSIELTPGSLLIMRGASQRSWQHQIPKTNKRIGVRLNITFRVLEQKNAE